MTEKPEIGSRMPDGTIYLGFHKDKHWYVAAGDARDMEGGNLSMTFNHAAMYAKDLKAHGHNDWEVPDLDILREMYSHKDTGAFKDTYAHAASWYWSSTPHPSSKGFGAGASLNGFSGFCFMSHTWFVRCVRSDSIPSKAEVKPPGGKELAEARLKALKRRAPAKMKLKKPLS